MPMARCRPAAMQIILPPVTYQAEHPVVPAAQAEAIRYRGVWREGRKYLAGEFATRSGALWHADSDTSVKPGTPDSGWTLAAKAGRVRL